MGAAVVALTNQFSPKFTRKLYSAKFQPAKWRAGFDSGKNFITTPGTQLLSPGAHPASADDRCRAIQPSAPVEQGL
jgi:hypothetical protein